MMYRCLVKEELMALAREVFEGSRSVVVTAYTCSSYPGVSFYVSVTGVSRPLQQIVRLELYLGTALVHKREKLRELAEHAEDLARRLAEELESLGLEAKVARALDI